MSDRQTWEAVDGYFTETLVPEQTAFQKALDASDASNLPAISVSANVGKFLHLLARMIGAKKVLEVGTLGGYSTLWFASALPEDGKVVTLEFEPLHAEVARANFRDAGLAERIEVRVGAAMESLPGVAADGIGPFDLAFIDADKKNNPGYFEWALKLVRPGGLILIDNVVRGGRVLDAATRDENVQGVRAVLDLISSERRVDATALQLVGMKGYDGLAICLVKP
ncbi:O-methyltransferase [Nisaea acidiphila]|uniref:O-methyltransferase n=1 Tax=Nisaea acidiphila TaxID=1862145 RepID=A0A9J7AY74_9PROT|nr:O-methyltransferase [Nisaea acidiphila]UUX50381.1 O-methyltransferase [Nisaea acidiphila]